MDMQNTLDRAIDFIILCKGKCTYGISMCRQQVNERIPDWVAKELTAVRCGREAGYGDMATGKKFKVRYILVRACPHISQNPELYKNKQHEMR